MIPHYSVATCVLSLVLFTATCVLSLVLFMPKESNAAEISIGESGTGLFCRRPPASKGSPLTVMFPQQFQVNIEAVSYANDSRARVSDAVESVDRKGGVSAVSRFEAGKGYQYIFNSTTNNYTFVNESATCVAGLPFRPFQVLNTTQSDPLLFPSNLKDGWLDNVSSILDVWTWATNNPKEIYKDETQTGHHEHGIPIEHYYVCKQAPDNCVIEIEICVSAPGVKMPFMENASLPIRIDVKRFHNDTKTGNSTQVEEFVGYRLSHYRSISEETRPEAFLPPPGVPCSNITVSSAPATPDLPNNFGVHIDYLDHEDRRIDIAKLNVDMDAHVVALEYTNNDTDIPLAAQSRLQNGKYKIVHDFDYGLEYIIDVSGQKCVSVANIPNDAGDTVYKETDKRRVITLKNASEILGIHMENATFYYVGERLLDGVVPADVWLCYTQVNETPTMNSRRKSIVHEVYFSKPNWQIHDGISSWSKPVLLALKVYHRVVSDEATHPPVVTTQRFHDFTVYPNKSPPWPLYDVGPCLNMSRNASYLVALGNDTLQNVETHGRGRVENAIRLAVAKEAGVSPLRVTNFYFEAVNNTFWVFFFIADRADANGAITEWRKDSINASEAMTNLNKTMMAKQLTVVVPLEDGAGYYFVSLSKGSLSLVPPLYKPPRVINVITKRGGYSGSSMAGLAICMLLIGGVLGLVLAFYMWKRNRGIAYQIYE